MEEKILDIFTLNVEGRYSSRQLEAMLNVHRWEIRRALMELNTQRKIKKAPGSVGRHWLWELRK